MKSYDKIGCGHSAEDSDAGVIYQRAKRQTLRKFKLSNYTIFLYWEEPPPMGNLYMLQILIKNESYCQQKVTVIITS